MNAKSRLGTLMWHSVGLAAALLLMTFGAIAMEALKSSRYFADPAVAAFVDDVQRGDMARVKQGLAAGISPNAQGSDGFRPIHFVFIAKTADVLRVLLAAGADPNARLVNGNPPLEFAVRMPNPDFTAALLEAKADPNARGENQSPVLFTATAYPTTQNMELLARAGADLDIAWAGKTPLLYAVASMSWVSAAVLLKLGANPAKQDRRGRTAGDLWCKQLVDQPVVEK